MEIEAQLASNSGCTGNSFRLEDRPWPLQPPSCPSPLWKTFMVASLATGIQFGWAIQLSLLTPYVKLLFSFQKYSLFIWIAVTISGMILQPVTGYYSDHSASRFGRRRPFIVAGVGLMVFAEFLIGFAVDFGYLPNDAKGHNHQTAPNFGYFMVGLFILGTGSNLIQVSCRALLGDMASGDHAKTHLGYASFSFFMALGNITGYTIGTYNHLYLVFPFSRTAICDIDCANLKSCTIISIALLVALTSLTLSFVGEKTYLPSMILEGDSQVTRARPPFFGALKGLLTRPMWILLSVTCLNWIALFLFLLFDTDWMGREVYGGTIGQPRYDQGVRAGAIGLTLNSVAIGVTALVIHLLVSWVGGAKRLWGIANMWLAICMAMAVYLSKMASHERHRVVDSGVVMPFGHVKAYALALFSLMGIPFAITWTIPFALASIFSVSSEAGQGFTIGVLNLAITIPQIFVSLTSGPWDDLFGGGNAPSFVVAAVIATVSTILSFTVLPEPK